MILSLASGYIYQVCVLKVLKWPDLTVDGSFSTIPEAAIIQTRHLMLRAFESPWTSLFLYADVAASCSAGGYLTGSSTMEKLTIECSLSLYYALIPLFKSILLVWLGNHLYSIKITFSKIIIP